MSGGSGSGAVGSTHAFERVAGVWNARNLRYAVAHGLGRDPRAYGRDLDVVVHRADSTEALRVAARVLSDAGFRIARPPRLWGDRIVAIRPEAPYRMLELHLLRGLAWRNVRLASTPRPSASRGPFAIDPWISVAKRVLHPALAGEVSRFDARPEELELSGAERDALLEGLTRLAGRSRAEAFFIAVESGDPRAIVAAARRAGRVMMLREAARSPVASVVGMGRAVGRRIGPAFRPCAPIVAVVGPDGAGKSTAIDHLSRTEGWVFTRVERRHWRPGVLPDLSAFTPGSIRARRFRVEPPAGAAGSRAGSPASGDDGGGPRPPRRRSGRLGRVRLAYYCADAWLGGWLRDRPAAGHQRLVLYDRCLLDMAVDPARYGLRDGAAVERWWTSLPRPDRVVLLAGSPDRIVERKPELTVPEVRRQIGEWRRLLAAGLVHDVVEADRPEREVAAALRRIVVEALLERNPPPPDLIASTPVSGRGASPPAATAGTERERCAS